MTQKLMSVCYFLSALTIFLSAALGENCPRQTISLDGTWQIAEGTLNTVPATFSRTVPVPGLVDLAEPSFERVRQGDFKDPNRDAYWYRREFNVDSLTDVARLKIHKAKYGLKAILNGTELGEYHGSSTPAYFDVSQVLRRGRNELVIRVGADLASIEGKAVLPIDREKEYYIPGIFDSVEIIFSGTPFIENIQTVPRINDGVVGIKTRLVNTGLAVEKDVKFTVKEWKSGKVVGSASQKVSIPANGSLTFDAAVTIADCQLWSPENPFLYVLETDTGADFTATRFGMRTFRFNPETKRAELNGKPYFMRGSNFTLYRFFEDAERRHLPWNKEWVRTLHERVKDMHWNCLRYCIGFPPRFWYDIADEVGILIQDEFPLWMTGPEVQRHLTVDLLVAEYTAWMRERWNHPSVVIWDASNETRSPQATEAVAKVRGLDLSNRPWDNSWMPPADAGDVLEVHPYHYMNPQFRFRDLGTISRDIELSHQQRDTTTPTDHAMVNNEYGWLWLNRDGTPTYLTRQLYDDLLGPNSTPEQRFHTYATYLAADTEFFRAYRKLAAVMHFTTLAYSREDGFTSDHWINLEKLEWEPKFYQYVRDAFAPVGLMIEFWNDRVFIGDAESTNIPVILINDLEAAWKGTVVLRLRKGEEIVWEKSQTGEIASFGTSTITFEAVWAKTDGKYRLEAELMGVDGKPVRSVRYLSLLDPQTATHQIWDAFASATYDPDRFHPRNAFDGDETTTWAGHRTQTSWIIFDLGEPRKFQRLEILWLNTFARRYNIRISNDMETWRQVHLQENGTGGREAITFDPVTARYIRINCLVRGEYRFGIKIGDFKVFER
jgi:hypothetical protein